MADRLPIKLVKEPLIDAIFEIRFDCTQPASDIIPGYLYSKLSGEKSLNALPTSQLPKAIRDGDPGLAYAPIKRLNWGKYFVNVGDRSVAVGCNMPYPGWAAFRQAIKDVLENLADHEIIKIIKKIKRCSLKYIDLIEATSLKEQLALLNLDITVANRRLEEQIFQFRAEFREDGCIHIVQLGSSAAIDHANRVRKGVIVDVDTILPINDISITELSENIEERIDRIHSLNKKMFFDCLKDETIEFLGPIYE